MSKKIKILTTQLHSFDLVQTSCMVHRTASGMAAASVLHRHSEQQLITKQTKTFTMDFWDLTEQVTIHLIFSRTFYKCYFTGGKTLLLLLVITFFSFNSVQCFLSFFPLVDLEVHCLKKKELCKMKFIYCCNLCNTNTKTKV